MLPVVSKVTHLTDQHPQVGVYKQTHFTFRPSIGKQKSPYIVAYRPELHRYLLNYPKATLADTTDFLYWGKYDFGAKLVIRISHVTIYPLEDGDSPGPRRGKDLTMG